MNAQTTGQQWADSVALAQPYRDPAALAAIPEPERWSRLGVRIVLDADYDPEFPGSGTAEERADWAAERMALLDGRLTAYGLIPIAECACCGHVDEAEDRMALWGVVVEAPDLHGDHWDLDAISDPYVRELAYDVRDVPAEQRVSERPSPPVPVYPDARSPLDVHEFALTQLHELLAINSPVWLTAGVAQLVIDRLDPRSNPRVTAAELVALYPRWVERDRREYLAECH